MKDILSMTLNEVEELVLSIGEKKFRAGQLFSWLMKGEELSSMSNIPKTIKNYIQDNELYWLPKIERKLVSQLDGTVKYLFSMRDGEKIESVVMSYKHGYTICVSCQCGCRMGCRFCASTIRGKVRDLEAGEILGQVVVAQRDLGIKISNIVMMGIGEPLDNYDNVVRFLQLVSSPDGLNIGQRHISLSTCGVVDKIYELAKLDLSITLSVSLHAYKDEVRSEIMPINRKWNIEKLLTACREYFKKTGRRISFEYTLIAGVNDSKKGAEELGAILKKYMGKMPLHVNLIPVNNVEERDFVATAADQAVVFMNTLAGLGINATIRRKLGADIDASCGQLRSGER